MDIPTPDTTTLLPAVAPSGAGRDAGRIEARGAGASFGGRRVLADVDLDIVAGQVTALIGPSGCGKSTFLRMLNRMHELVPGAAMEGRLTLDGGDLYDPARRLSEVRSLIGMVFQKPNPFPTMSIYDNVVAGLNLTGRRVDRDAADELVWRSLRRASLWEEVRDRLRDPAAGLSGGQQQRLCIARALAVDPRVLLMDEPCSALDPTSTHRVEETIAELRGSITVVIVTHNMQQAARVSDATAFFLASATTPGTIVESGRTRRIFEDPTDPRTRDYVEGRFG